MEDGEEITSSEGDIGTDMVEWGKVGYKKRGCIFYASFGVTVLCLHISRLHTGDSAVKAKSPQDILSGCDI